jgi:hypothetical protein
MSCKENLGEPGAHRGDLPERSPHRIARFANHAFDLQGEQGIAAGKEDGAPFDERIASPEQIHERVRHVGCPANTLGEKRSRSVRWPRECGTARTQAKPTKVA